jgi:hypothetical protein
MVYLALFVGGGLSYLAYRKLSCECHERRMEKKARGKGKKGGRGHLDVVGESVRPLESVLSTPEVHHLVFLRQFQGPVGKTGYVYENPVTHVRYVGYAPILTSHMRK